MNFLIAIFIIIAMYVGDNKFVRKQCNIGKYETVTGFVLTNSTKQVEFSPLQTSTLRQTNIFHHPLPGFPKIYSGKDNFKFESSSLLISSKKYDSKSCPLLPTDTECLARTKPKLAKSYLDESYNQLSKNSRNIYSFSSLTVPPYEKYLSNNNQNSVLSEPLKMKDLNGFSDLDTCPLKLNSTISSASELSNKSDVIDKLETLITNNNNTDNIPMSKFHISGNQFKQNICSDIHDLCLSDLDAEEYSQFCLSNSSNIFNKAISQFSTTESTPVNDTTLVPSQLLIDSINETKKVHFDCSSSGTPVRMPDSLLNQSNCDKSNGVFIISSSSALENSNHSPKLRFCHGNTVSTDRNNVITSETDQTLTKHLLVCNNDIEADRTSHVSLECIADFSRSQLYAFDRSADLYKKSQLADKQTGNPLTEVVNTSSNAKNDPCCFSNNFNFHENIKEQNTALVEEDILHSTLNRLSKTVHNFAPLGISLKLIKLQRILQAKSNDQQEKIMSTFRYFNKWKKNAKLLKTIRNQQKEKLKRADLHYIQRQKTRCFLKWHAHVKIQNAIADTFYKRCMFVKGMSALQWMIVKSHERDETLAQNRKKSTLYRTFHQWKERFLTKQKKRLTLYLSKWKKQYYFKILFNILDEKHSNETMIKSYGRWRERLEMKRRLNIAENFHNLGVKRFMFIRWTLYTANCSVNRSQKEVAFLQYRRRVMMKTLVEWKHAATKVKQAELYNEKKILHRFLKDWQTNCYYLKIHHNRQFRASLSFRDKSRKKQAWFAWKKELMCAQTQNSRKVGLLRSSFFHWRFELNRRIYLDRLICKFYEKIMLKACLVSWKQYITVIEKRRLKACGLIKRVLVRHIFTSWREMSLEIRRRHLALKALRSMYDQRLQANSFQRWKLQYLYVLAYRKAEKEKHNKRARNVIARWFTFVENKRRKKNFLLLKERFERSSMKDYFSKWLKTFEMVKQKQYKAKQYHTRVSKEKCRKIMREWHKVTEEAMSIKPFIEKRCRKICSKYFDVWRRVVKKKRSNFHIYDELIQRRTGKIFYQWRDKLVQLTNERKMNELYQRNLKIKTISNWKEFVGRHINEDKLHKRLLKDTLANTFNFWMKRMEKRHHERKEIFLQSQRDRAALMKYFKCWSDYVEEESSQQREVELYFERIRNLQIKARIFANWKKSRNDCRLAQNLREIKNRKIIRELFQVWKGFVEASIEEKSLIFTASLHSSSKNDLSTSSRMLPIDQFSNFDHQNFLIEQNAVISDYDQIYNHEGTTDSGLDLIKDNLRSDASTISFPFRFTHPSSSGLSEEVVLNPPGVEVETASGLSQSLSTYPQTLSSSLEDVSDRILSYEDLNIICDDDEDENDSVISEAMITQREVKIEVHPDQNIQLHCNTSLEKTFDQPVTRPDQFLLIVQDPQQSKLESLVRHFILCISNPLLTPAFHQWKLFVSILKWRRQKTTYAHNFLSDLKLRMYFVLWRKNTNSLKFAIDHSSVTIKRNVFKRWMSWSNYKLQLRRKESILRNQNHHSLMRKYFMLWTFHYKKRSTLNDILAYWKANSSRKLREKDAELQRDEDLELMRNSFMTWKAKQYQLQESALHYNCALCRKHLRGWILYTEEKLTKKYEMVLVLQRFEKKKYLRMWQRALHVKVISYEMRSQVMKSWLANLLDRWQQLASGIAKRREGLKIYTECSNKLIVRNSFLAWKEKYETIKTSKRFHDKFLLSNCFSRFRYIVMDKKTRLKKLKYYRERQHYDIMSSIFQIWRRLYSINLILKKTAEQEKRKLFARWRVQVKNKKAFYLGIKSLQRFYLIIWFNQYKEAERKNNLARLFVIKWKKFTSHKRHLFHQAGNFVTSHTQALLEFRFESWKRAYNQHSMAKICYNNHLKSSCFHAWYNWSNLKQTRRQALFELRFVQNRMLICTAYTRWRKQAVLCKCREEVIVRFNQLRISRVQRSTWLMWKDKLKVKKSESLYRKTIQAKVFMRWIRYNKINSVIQSNLILFRNQTNKSCMIVSFNTWKISLRIFRKTRHHALSSLRAKAFFRWRGWTERSRLLQRKHKDMSARKSFTQLKFFFEKWQERSRILQNMKFLSDEKLCQGQIRVLKSCWIIWLQQKEAKQFRIVTLQYRVINQWKIFARKQTNNRKSLEYHKKVLLRKTCIRWFQSTQMLRFKRKQKDTLIGKTFRSWLNKFSVLLFASSYNQTNVQKKFWSCWKLRYALIRINYETNEEIKKDLLMTTFKAWRMFIKFKKKMVPTSSSNQRSKIPRIKRN